MKFLTPMKKTKEQDCQEDSEPLFVKFLLHKNLARTYPARGIYPIHASDLTKDDFCPMRCYLSKTLNKKPPAEFLGTSLRTTFDMGNDIATRIVSDANYLGDYIVGDWQCHCGETFLFQTRPSKCEKCQKTTFMYNEVIFQHAKAKFTGAIDFLIAFPGITKLRIVELKSMDKDLFKLLKGPLAEHRLRTNLYLRLIEKSNHPHKDRIDTKIGHVLYTMKGYGVKDTFAPENGVKDLHFSPYKEFLVERDDTQTLDLMIAANAVAEAVEDENKGASEVPKLCEKASDPNAKACFLSTDCFK